jgi:iron complex outermembrane recepter protein
MRRSGVILVMMFLARISVSAASQPDPQDLKVLSIEQLMEIDVTLGTREPEPVRSTAAAIHVITADDIRRSGVTTIPDALALATGVHVARFNNGSWAISTRGFNSTSANKLLVMIDGRTVYSPLFSGAFWNTVDYVLQDIDRIEVIRGPGATLWGANAVNGVINIITKDSRDTQGGYVALGGGNEDPALADVRYGGATAAATYRVYAKYAARDDQRLDNGESAGDARRREQFGFRLDGRRPGGDSWLIKGDAFHSHDDLPDRPAGEFADLSLQARWSRALAAGANLDIQSYYRREYRRVPQQLAHYINTADLDLQHAFTWRTRHRIVSGAGYRLNADQTFPGTVAFEPASRSYSLFSAFAQDELMVRPNRVYLTAGVKVERNTFSGAEWQPNLRARLELSRRQMLWAAVSRAVRRPTRLDVDVRALTPAGVVVAVGGGDDYRAESLVAGEVGYRIQPHATIALDATVFRHRYDDLRSQELPVTGPPIVVGNTLEADSHGLELAATVQPLPVWRMHVSYAYLDLSIARKPGSRDIGGGSSEANDPRHQVALRTSVDLLRHVELDAQIRHVGALPNPRLPAYSELNMRVGWHPTSRVELSVAGQDLLHDRHAEFGPLLPLRHEFERSVRAAMALTF